MILATCKQNQAVFLGSARRGWDEEALSYTRNTQLQKRQQAKPRAEKLPILPDKWRVRYDKLFMESDTQGHVLLWWKIRWQGGELWDPECWVHVSNTEGDCSTVCPEKWEGWEVEPNMEGQEIHFVSLSELLIVEEGGTNLNTTTDLRPTWIVLPGHVNSTLKLLFLPSHLTHEIRQASGVFQIHLTESNFHTQISHPACFYHWQSSFGCHTLFLFHSPTRAFSEQLYNINHILPHLPS